MMLNVFRLFKWANPQQELTNQGPKYSDQRRLFGIFELNHEDPSENISTEHRPIDGRRGKGGGVIILELIPDIVFLFQNPLV